MLFEVRNISKSFKNKDIITGFSLEVEQGDMIALVGKRRQGKTTLMQMLAGIIPVDEGEIYFDGRLVGSKGKTAGLCKLRRNRIGYITTEAILMPDMTVYDNLLLAMSHKRGSVKKKKLQAKEVLRNLGLKGKGRFFPKELSTIDKQKVCVARAIINEPELLICDEPTDILEGYGAEQMMDILEILNSAGYTIILSTHSKRIASRCRKVYPVHEGLDLSGLAVVKTESEYLSEEESAAVKEKISDGIEADAVITEEAGSDSGVAVSTVDMAEIKDDSESVDESGKQSGENAESDGSVKPEDGLKSDDNEKSEDGVNSDGDEKPDTEENDNSEEDLPEIDLSDIF